MTSPFKNMALKEATRTRHHNEENNEHTMAIEENHLSILLHTTDQITIQTLTIEHCLFNKNYCKC